MKNALRSSLLAYFRSRSYSGQCRRENADHRLQQLRKLHRLAIRLHGEIAAESIPECRGG